MTASTLLHYRHILLLRVLILKTVDSKKKDVAVENKDKRHDFESRLWSQMTALQSEFDV